ncbi:alpha/beta hydrolase [Micromonospora sp. b486]|uniref:alpha/beta fold hydrolase n=1 Tax=Micromonospora sp. b486 TaxID=3053986 RepID=UPI00338D39CB
MPRLRRERQTTPGVRRYTLAADVAGLIRALGERSATVVGTGAGGLIGWTAASFHPTLVRRLVVLGAPHRCGCARPSSPTRAGSSPRPPRR